MTPTTPALEACRLLLEEVAKTGTRKTVAKADLWPAVEMAMRAHAATQQDDTRTLNIGSGR